MAFQVLLLRCTREFPVAISLLVEDDYMRNLADSVAIHENRKKDKHVVIIKCKELGH